MIKEKILEFSHFGSETAMSLAIIDNIVTAVIRAEVALGKDALEAISQRFKLMANYSEDRVEREYYLATAKFFAEKAKKTEEVKAWNQTSTPSS